MRRTGNNSVGSGQSTYATPRLIPDTTTFPTRCDANQTVESDVSSPGPSVQGCSGATGGGRSRRESQDGGWRRSASTTPAESTKARMARTTCSGSEDQAAHRRARRASTGANSCKSVPGSRCRGAAGGRAEIRKSLFAKELTESGLRVQFPSCQSLPSAAIDR
jgi:hypothetical protein